MSNISSSHLNIKFREALQAEDWTSAAQLLEQLEASDPTADVINLRRGLQDVQLVAEDIDALVSDAHVAEQGANFDVAVRNYQQALDKIITHNVRRRLVTKLEEALTESKVARDHQDEIDTLLSRRPTKDEVEIKQYLGELEVKIDALAGEEQYTASVAQLEIVHAKLVAQLDEGSQLEKSEKALEGGDYALAQKLARPLLESQSKRTVREATYIVTDTKDLLDIVSPFEARIEQYIQEKNWTDAFVELADMRAADENYCGWRPLWDTVTDSQAKQAESNGLEHLAKHEFQLADQTFTKALNAYDQLLSVFPDKQAALANQKAVDIVRQSIPQIENAYFAWKSENFGEAEAILQALDETFESQVSTWRNYFSVKSLVQSLTKQVQSARESQEQDLQTLKQADVLKDQGNLEKAAELYSSVLNAHNIEVAANAEQGLRAVQASLNTYEAAISNANASNTSAEKVAQLETALAAYPLSVEVKSKLITAIEQYAEELDLESNYAALPAQVRRLRELGSQHPELSNWEEKQGFENKAIDLCKVLYIQAETLWNEVVFDAMAWQRVQGEALDLQQQATQLRVDVPDIEALVDYVNLHLRKREDWQIQFEAAIEAWRQVDLKAALKNLDALGKVTELDAQRALIQQQKDKWQKTEQQFSKFESDLPKQIRDLETQYSTVETAQDFADVTEQVQKIEGSIVAVTDLELSQLPAVLEQAIDSFEELKTKVAELDALLSVDDVSNAFSRYSTLAASHYGNNAYRAVGHILAQKKADLIAASEKELSIARSKNNTTEELSVLRNLMILAAEDSERQQRYREQFDSINERETFFQQLDELEVRFQSELQTSLFDSVRTGERILLKIQKQSTKQDELVLADLIRGILNLYYDTDEGIPRS